MKGLDDFARFVQENGAPRAELEALSREKKGRALDEAIVAWAAARGFAFTVDELELKIEEGLAKLLVDPALEDEQLDDIVAEKPGCFVGWIGRALFGAKRLGEGSA